MVFEELLSKKTPREVKHKWSKGAIIYTRYNKQEYPYREK